MFVFKFLSFSKIRNSKPSLLWRLASLSLSSDFVFRFSHFLYPLTDISLSKRPKKTFPTVGPSYCFIKSSRSLGKSRFSPSLLFHWVSVHWGFREWQRAAIHSVRGKKNKKLSFREIIWDASIAQLSFLLIWWLMCRLSCFWFLVSFLFLFGN